LELLSKDVLLGRGSGPNDHNGNIQFRELISQRKKEYLSTNNRQTKATIAAEIVNKVIQDGGRFLKKLNAMDAATELPKILKRFGIVNNEQDYDSDDDDVVLYNRMYVLPRDVYEIQDHETALEKAKQALRQGQFQNSSTEEAPKEVEDSSQSLTMTESEHSPLVSTNETDDPGFSNDKTDDRSIMSSETQVNTQPQRLIGGNDITSTTDNQNFNDWNNNGTVPITVNELKSSNSNDNNIISPSNFHDLTVNDKDDEEILPIVNNDASPIPMAPPLFLSHGLQQPQQHDNTYNQLMQQQNHSIPLMMSSLAEQPQQFMVSPVPSAASTANSSCLLDQNTTPSSSTLGYRQTFPTSTSSQSQSHLYQFQKEQIRSLQEQLEVERQNRSLNQRMELEQQTRSLQQEMEIERQKRSLREKLEMELQQQELDQVRSVVRDNEEHYKQQQQQQDPQFDVLDGYATYTNAIKMVKECNDHSIGGGFHPIGIANISCEKSNSSNDKKQNTSWVYPENKKTSMSGPLFPSMGLFAIEKELFQSTSNSINGSRNNECGVDKNDDANSVSNESRQSLQMSVMMESIKEISLNDDSICSLKRCDSQQSVGSIHEIIAEDIDGFLSTAMSAISLMSMMNDSTDSFIGLTSNFGGCNKGSPQNATWSDVDLTNYGGPVVTTSRIATIAGIDLRPQRRSGGTCPAA